jgi:hypothetical protein
MHMNEEINITNPGSESFRLPHYAAGHLLGSEVTSDMLQSGMLNTEPLLGQGETGNYALVGIGGVRIEGVTSQGIDVTVFHAPDGFKEYMQGRGIEIQLTGLESIKLDSNI